MKILYLLLFALFLVTAGNLKAQYYDTGEDPARLKWLQIKTEHFRVIYPENFGTEGINYARSLDESYARLFPGYYVKKIRIPVIIHNNTTFSNGYVAWAPRRIELYPTPEQNSIPGDPVEQLTLHEMTHVMQMKTLNRGITGTLSLFLGEQAPGLVSSLLPFWYLEGEAVLNETRLTESGRGRAPSFQKQIKAISVERGNMYRYDKILNGSYRDFIPDHYKYGYQMVSWAYKKYDPDIWNKVLKLTGNAPILLNPVNFSLRANTGLSKRKLFIETFDTLARIWTEETKLPGIRSYESLSPLPGKGYTGYYSPVKVDEESYAAIKTSLTSPPEFVLINASDRSEKRIHVPGNIYPYHFTYARRNLVWVETQPDPRWSNRDYSVIKRFDLRNGSTKQLTWRTRYLSASISPDGKLIAATENTTDNKNNLVLIEPSTGKILKTVPAPGNSFLQRPQWSNDGSAVTLISLTKEGEGIISFKLKDYTWDSMIRESPVDFQSTFLRNDTLFFVSSVSGTENIYFRTPDRNINRLTNSKFGATDLLVTGNSVIFSDYDFRGSKICYTDLRVDPSFRSNDSLRSYFIIDQISSPVLNKVQDKGKYYTPVPYRKWLHPLKFHSWLPFYADIEEIQSDPLAIQPGLTLFSQNNLSTVITSVGYEYSENLHKLHSRLTWKGWYPVYETSIDYGHAPSIYKMGSNIGNPVNVRSGIYYTNSLYIPLTFSNGKYSQHIRPSISSVYQNNYIYLKEDSTYDYGQTLISGRFFFSNYYRTVNRDIYPRMAQVVDLGFNVYPLDRKIYGYDIILRTAVYLPGFFRNNGIKLRYETEFQVIEKLLTMNRVNFPRGYKNIISEELEFYSVDYVTPLLYPDFNIGSLLYLKRIRAGLFYDYANGTGNYYLKNNNGSLYVDSFHDYSESFSSFGAQLIADFHVSRLPYMVSTGIQAAWTRGEKKPVLEMIFTVDIFGMSIGRTRNQQQLP